MASRRLPLVPVVVATVLAVAAAGGVFLLLGGSGDGSSGATSRDDAAIELSPTPTDLPTSAEEVELTALDRGQDRLLGEFLGERPVVLNFFASWCVPCLREMPAFEAVHQELGDQVTFLGLAVRDTPEDARAIVEETGVTYPAFGDGAGRAITYFGGIAMPTTVFIDASGEVTAVSSRELSERQLRDQVAELAGAEG